MNIWIKNINECTVFTKVQKSIANFSAIFWISNLCNKKRKKCCCLQHSHLLEIPFSMHQDFLIDQFLVLHHTNFIYHLK